MAESKGSQWVVGLYIGGFHRCVNCGWSSMMHGDGGACQ